MYGTLGLFAWTLEVIGVLTGFLGFAAAFAPGGGAGLMLMFSVTSAACFGAASEFIRRERREMKFERTKNWAYYLFLLQAILSLALALIALPAILSEVSQLV